MAVSNPSHLDELDHRDWLGKGPMLCCQCTEHVCNYLAAGQGGFMCRMGLRLAC